jgi:hypothetical protein
MSATHIGDTSSLPNKDFKVLGLDLVKGSVASFSSNFIFVGLTQVLINSKVDTFLRNKKIG